MNTRHLIASSLAALLFCACDPVMDPQAGTNDEVTTSLQLLADNMQILNSVASNKAAARKAGTPIKLPDTGFDARYIQHEGWEEIHEIHAFGTLDSGNRSRVFFNAHRTETFNQDSIQSVSSTYLHTSLNEPLDSSDPLQGGKVQLDCYSTSTMRTGFIYRERPLDSSEVHHFESLQPARDPKAFAAGYPRGSLFMYPGDLVVPLYAGQTRTSDNKLPIFKADRIVGYANLYLEASSVRLTNITDDRGTAIAPRASTLGPLPGDSLGVQIGEWSIDSTTMPLALEIDVSWNFTPLSKSQFERMKDRRSWLGFDLYGQFRQAGKLLIPELDSPTGQRHFRVPLDSVWTPGSIDSQFRLQVSLFAAPTSDSAPYSMLQSKSLWQQPSIHPRP